MKRVIYFKAFIVKKNDNLFKMRLDTKSKISTDFIFRIENDSFYFCDETNKM